MRKDMDKVIVERPRRGSRNSASDKKGRYKNIDFFDEESLERLSDKESMARRRQYGWEAKELNENLAPLYRYLLTNCGRNWDQVYSEIRENINPNSAVQAHILQHLDFYIEKVQVIDGEVWTLPPYERPVTEMNYSRGFYVCPFTGNLVNIDKAKKYKYKPKPITYIQVDKFMQCHKLGGHWYLVFYNEIPENQRKPYRLPSGALAENWVNDAFMGLVTAHRCLSEYGNWMYAIRHKQLNKKEIKQYKVKEFEQKLLAEGYRL